MHPLNDTLMGLSAVTFAVVSVLLYTLLAFEALTSRGWGALVEEALRGQPRRWASA
jgi:hypothetical protein